ncbi:spermidine/putrescine ABC transporter ATP-binding protein [Natronococcus pandeyae]|uniref:Molybdate/tungstate import ATP-binding protein WtpC n=1 Tax=Natronococcus pandeyae TaxID=2055836 RepID=A0A8J8PW42_9EURY|nr:ABC transporter ATP-binding protein [Natronococcus pandeyae]TYL35951.1 spermidine/putrescine ABC transporter ATP-binding protein [Natronococcus pandeyae]
MSYLEVETVTKRFDDLVAVDDVSFSAEEGEFLSLLGPSGCGKTTMLRMIAGLETPTTGEIRIRGEDVTDQPPYERDIGMMFQHYALFPHKTVGENVGFPLKMRGVGAEERREQVAEALEMVRLPDAIDRSPTELSGGQQQRVALARALVFEPDVLLLDEPLSALDRVLRQQMRVELERIQKEIGVTTVYVTHDQMEAFSLSDTVVVLEDGHLSQQGSPIDIYENPTSEFVGDFIGQSTKLTGTVTATEDRPVLETPGVHELRLPSSVDVNRGESEAVFLRAEKLDIRDQPSGHENAFPATIRVINYLGEKTVFYCDLEDGTEVIVSKQGFTNVDEYERGDEVYVVARPEDLVIARSVDDRAPQQVEGVR